MPVPSPLPDPLVELVAQRFRVLGEPARIKLLDALRSGPASVGELATRVGPSQQNASKHLGVLHSAGLVQRTRTGSTAQYVITDPSVFTLCGARLRRPARQVQRPPGRPPTPAGAGRSLRDQPADAPSPQANPPAVDVGPKAVSPRDRYPRGRPRLSCCPRRRCGRFVAPGGHCCRRYPHGGLPGRRQSRDGDASAEMRGACSCSLAVDKVNTVT